jgi:hypothetical protein
MFVTEYFKDSLVVRPCSTYGTGVQNASVSSLCDPTNRFSHLPASISLDFYVVVIQ